MTEPEARSGMAAESGEAGSPWGSSAPNGRPGGLVGLDMIGPCGPSIEADLAALSEGFCPDCKGRVEPHNRHVRCRRCNRCMEVLTRQRDEPVYATWSDCAYI